MNPSASLGARLDALFDLVSVLQNKYNYSCHWDCCCDHGYLGIKLLSHNICEKMVFVDQVPHIIQQLAKKLAPFDTGKHELMACDAALLDFDVNKKHLVILAGVGGEKSVQILQTMQDNHAGVCIDYVFCPSTSQLALRDYLSEKNMKLEYQSSVLENKRNYQILFTRSENNN